MDPCYRAAVELRAEWLGRIGYQEAWDRQHALVAARATGEAPDTLLLLEHDAVLTLGRNADPANIRASEAVLAARGIRTIRVERGGEVTYHGPGQLVAYPIVRLAAAGLLLRPFVRALELAMVDTARSYGIPAERRDGYPGCSVHLQGVDGPPRKLGALGLRVEKGVTYPRHRAQRDHRPRRLRAHRTLRPDGHLCHLRGPGAGWSGDQARPSKASVLAAAERFETALRARLDEAVVASVAPRPVLSPA